MPVHPGEHPREQPFAKLMLRCLPGQIPGTHGMIHIPSTAFPLPAAVSAKFSLHLTDLMLQKYFLSSGKHFTKIHREKAQFLLRL